MKKLISILIISIFLISGCSKNNENIYTEKEKPSETIEENTNNDDNIKEQEEQNNDDKLTEEMLIEKAIEALYNKTGENINEVAFVHNQNESYVKEDDVKNQYYIFNIVHGKGTGHETISDYNLLVDRDTYEVYIYLPDSTLEHYSN